jgi:uncharacterized protein YjbJ (UPF0337 family)
MSVMGPSSQQGVTASGPEPANAGRDVTSDASDIQPGIGVGGTLDGGTTIATQRSSSMADNETGPEAGVKGVVEGVKGKVKEAAGALSGNDNLKHEGEAQQKKADAQREVATKEAEAEKARAEAEAHEAEERAHQ